MHATLLPTWAGATLAALAIAGLVLLVATTLRATLREDTEGVERQDAARASMVAVVVTVVAGLAYSLLEAFGGFPPAHRRRAGGGHRSGVGGRLHLGSLARRGRMIANRLPVLRAERRVESGRARGPDQCLPPDGRVIGERPIRADAESRDAPVGRVRRAARGHLHTGPRGHRTHSHRVTSPTRRPQPELPEGVGCAPQCSAPSSPPSTLPSRAPPPHVLGERLRIQRTWRQPH